MKKVKYELYKLYIIKANHLTLLSFIFYKELHLLLMRKLLTAFKFLNNAACQNDVFSSAVENKRNKIMVFMYKPMFEIF